MSETAKTEDIRVERIVGTKQVGLGLWWVVLIPLFLSIVGILIAYPMMLTLSSNARRSAVLWAEREGRAAFQRFVGCTPEYMDVGPAGAGNDLNALSASGMAYDKGRIYVLEEGVAAQIPWSRIRSWNWQVEGYDQTVMHGRTTLAVNHSVREANINSAARAFRNSGFVITTSDIKKREWKFQTMNKNLLQKWEEIFTQMNEGQLERV